MADPGHPGSPGLPRRQWVIGTLRTGAGRVIARHRTRGVEVLAQGGDTLAVFKNGFVQANVLGPLIGLSQATALRDRRRRWMWWFAANLTTYLLGAAAYDFGKWLLGVFSISRQISPPVPLPGFLIDRCGCCG